jgi:gamma-glutamyltranspeptidase / glutathione hydrolase
MRVWMCLFMLWRLGLPALAQDRDYGRSMVVTGRGIAATSQVLASQAGAHILERGGSAIDAAIAANAVLGGTEPMMNGMGGDLFLLYWDAKSGKLYGLNASGWAPQGLTIDFLKKQGINSMPDDGIHSVTALGAVAGWAKAHQRFGRLPWRDLFTAAIYYAEHGSAVGEQFSNPDLGKTLRSLADQGAREFYEGEIAKAILKTSNSLGGTMQPGQKSSGASFAGGAGLRAEQHGR